MVIKRLICSVGLFLTVQSFPALAVESSSIYQYYLNEGIKAYERHSDEEASRYFAWAHEIDPSAQDPIKYAKSLSARQQFEADAGDSPSAFSPYFEEMMAQGKEALQHQDYVAAKQYFYTAHLLDRNASQPLEYLNLVKRQGDGRVVVEQPVAVKPPVVQESLVAPAIVLPPRKMTISGPKSSADPVALELDRAEKRLPQKTEAIRVVPLKKDPKRIEKITLADILQHAQGGRALVKIDMGASLVVEGKNIQKFLVVTEDPVAVKLIAPDQLQIDAKRIGVTFIHIWDDFGRRTIYVQVVFPIPPEGLQVIKVLDAEHARPFRFRYSNDWGSYYRGSDIPGMQRKSVNFQENIGVEGETPYGYFDASGSTIGWHQPVRFVTYTTGLTNMPVPGTSDFNVRFFDASRYLTPLTLPGSSLRGAYADVNIFKSILGLSVTHGREMGTFGYFAEGSNILKSSYVDAGKVLLFPKDPKKHYSFNYARGTGERESYLTKDAYSIEGQQKIGRLTLDGELAKDDKTHAATAGGHWDSGDFHTALNMRNTGKEFTTVTGTGPQQGVVGATWTTDSVVRKATVSTALDVYQNHLFYNQNDPGAVNYSLSGQVGIPLNELYFVDANANYSDTPGDLSPRNYLGGAARLRRMFDVWGNRKGSVYAGGSYQRSRFALTPTAEYDRYGTIAGLSLPLTSNLSFNGNYEYSWLTELSSSQDYNPNVLTAGLTYYKQVTEKLYGNMALNYRQESGLGGTNSFLAGEDSLGYSAGLSYNPARDVTLFFDGRLNNIWGKTTSNVSYNDMDLRMGLRSSWGTGFYWDPQGTVEGVVFKDKNSNAKLDKGEEGIADIKVKVGDSEVVTDAHGWYHKTVKAKKVLVTPVAESVPAGFIFSTPAFEKVIIRHGLRDRVDFGLTTRSGIFGVLFVDKNGNGTPDQGDEFLHRVKVTLDGKAGQITDPQGAYFFSNIAPGKHVVLLDIKTLPIKYIPLIKLQNEVNVTEGTTYVLHIPMKIK